MTGDSGSRIREIERGAYERHVLELVREYAPEQERAEEIQDGEPARYQIDQVELEGEYPATRIRLRRTDRRTGQEIVIKHPIWADDSFRNAHGKMYDPTRVAGDILMLARGG